MGCVLQEGGDCPSAVCEEEVVGICGGCRGREDEPSCGFKFVGSTQVKGRGKFFCPCGESGEVISFGSSGVVVKRWVEVETLEGGEGGRVEKDGAKVGEGVFIDCEIGWVCGGGELRDEEVGKVVWGEGVV